LSKYLLRKHNELEELTKICKNNEGVRRVMVMVFNATFKNISVHAILVSDWSISKKSSSLKLLSHMN
jgi:hypothetical protein